MMLKVQTLSGGRGLSGGIVPVSNKDDFKASLKNLFASPINSEEIKSVLAEEKIEHNKKDEYYGLLIRIILFDILNS